MKIAITGANGMLGADLYKMLSDEKKMVLFPLYGQKEGFYPNVDEKAKIDITQKSETEGKLAYINPDVIIHTAGYTDVDGCELNRELAYQVNAIGTENVVLAAKKIGALVIYIGTDYIFDGEKNSPYREKDTPNPINFYGETKLAGERFLKDILDRWIIVRTSWLFGKNGKNFVKAILEQAKVRKVLRVVNDQVGSPTYTKDFASTISLLLKNKLENAIYHVTNQGFCSWFEFANKIIQYSGISDVIVEPMTSMELNRPAKRPRYSVLENYEWQVKGYPLLRTWEEALKDYLRETGELKVEG